MNPFVLPLSLMLVLVLLELAALRWFRGEAPPWREVVLNLNSGHILMWLGRGLEVAGFTWTYQHVSLRWLTQAPIWFAWTFAFFAWDFGFYWLHRAHHKYAFLWAVHVVHHEGASFSLSLGVRNAWLSSLTSLPFFVPLAVLGVTPVQFVLVSSVHYAVQFYNHGGWVRSSGWLDEILVGPCNHRVHHGCNPEYLDRNFGGTFIFWDKLFGTFQRALPNVPIRCGVRQPTPSDNPLWANVAPVLRYLGVAAPRLKAQRTLVPAGWIASAGFLLFAMVIHYIALNGYWPTRGHVAGFVLIFGLTLVLGALSDGRTAALWLWPLLTLAAFALQVLLLHLSGQHDPWGLTTSGLLGLHGLLFALRQARAELAA